MGLVDNHQVPMDLTQTGQDLQPLGQVQRRDQLFLLQPLVHAELIANVGALENDELLVELLLEFPLPLEGEIRGGDDQDSLGQAPQLQFPDEQAGHDGLAGAGVVGQQETYARQLQQEVVDCLQLVRQGIDPRYRQPKVGVKLVGNAQAISLNAKAQQSAVALVGGDAAQNLHGCEVGFGQNHPAELFRTDADDADCPCAITPLPDGFNSHRLVERRPDEDLAFLQNSHDARPSGR